LCLAATLACSVRHERQAQGLHSSPTCGARRAPVPHAEATILKAVVTGLAALALCATPVAAHATSSSDLGVQLAGHLKTLQKDASVIRFFETHRWLLTDPRFEKQANVRLVAARRSLAATQARATRARAEIARRKQEAKRKRLMTALARSPEKAICHVFGAYCGQALQVARCESGYQTNAQNGQYLGLFQMGSNERRLFGHGASALDQARAAHRYFVASGRDWSPWSCKPWM
jgi:hypothetical protein